MPTHANGKGLEDCVEQSLLLRLQNICSPYFQSPNAELDAYEKLEISYSICDVSGQIFKDGTGWWAGSIRNKNEGDNGDHRLKR